jgi:hypothetical protein
LQEAKEMGFQRKNKLAQNKQVDDTSNGTNAHFPPIWTKRRRKETKKWIFG